MSYGENSIGTLDGAMRVRTRPAAVLGSDGLDGALHCIIEMYGNIVDERTSGYGDKIDIKLYSDGSISMRDYGRGVPLGWNESKQTYNWHLVYNEMYGGGKYDDNQEKLKAIKDWSTFDEKMINYLYSVGLNGLGASATQYCSEFFNVISIRRDEEAGKNYKYSMQFKHGLPIIEGEPVDVFTTRYDFSTYHQEIEDTDEHTGTFVHWKPDSEVFSDVNIPVDWVLNLCRDISFIAGMSVHCEIESTGQVIDYEASNVDSLLPALYGGKLHEVEDKPYIFSFSDFSHGTITKSGKSVIWVAKYDISMGVSKSSHSLDSVCYHNAVRMRTGLQYDALNDAVESFLSDKVRAKGFSLTREDFNGTFVFALSSYSNIASLRGQTKDGVEDWFIYDFIKSTVLHKLNIEYSKGNKEIEEIVTRVCERASIRMQLKEAEKQIKAINKTKRAKDPEKFKTCTEYMNKDYHRTELWITEGDSAGDSVVAARDGMFQAVLPIKGKGLNVLKSSISKILANTEITEIISLLGTGIDLNIKDMKLFNIDDLKFDKIIIATDADEDGYQIRVLLFVLFYKLTPKLLSEGKIYIAETPRFALVLKDGSMVYALDDEECQAKMQEYAGRWSEIKRYKGLGEVDAEILRETTVGVEHRNLIPVTVDFDNELEADIIDALFGEDKHNQRKEILTTVLGKEVGDDLVESLDMLARIEQEDIDEGIEYEDWN